MRFEIFSALCHRIWYHYASDGDGRMKTLIGVAALLVAMATTGTAADRRAEPQYSPAVPQYSWAAMPLLPRPLQNHCGYYNGHFICADHCGADYQVYYCPATASGCCHIGLGYCDGAGRLRCSPAWF
jgi:hypothetical protein